MTDLRKAAEEAAKVLANALSIDFNDKRDWNSYKHDVEYATNLLVQALAQPEQKLIGWNDGEPQYVAQPKPWVGLTDDDMHTIRGDAFNKNVDDMNWAVAIARKIDFILRRRNT